MRRKSEETKRRIVDAAYGSFWRSGYTRTTVDGIAAQAGVTKRTLYSYFRSKDDLLEAVLVHYSDLAAERLKQIGTGLPDEPNGLVDTYYGQLARWAKVTPRWSGSGISRLVMELADLPGHPARQMAKRSKAASESWLARRLCKAGVMRSRERARELMLLTEGAMTLTVIHGNRGYIDAAARAAKRLIESRQA